MVEFEDMASTSSATPSQSTPIFTYDVFLSFRGEDTRKTIVDHLYHWLEQKGIHAFKDDERLEKGQNITPALLQAIQESRFAVVVFSKNYASSTWCLDELAKIMESKDKLNQVVVPIFYDIEPSHVRKQTGSFEEAFAKHEENEGKGRVERWKKALTEAGSIAGHDLHGDEYNGYELKCIEAVIADISKQLPPPQSVQKNLVGLELPLEEIRMKLKLWDEDVKLILGIWGMGGIGKTTIVRAAFDQFYSGFDGSCFLADISNLARKDGLEALQKKLLSNVLKENSIDIDDVDKGIRMIKKRLESKRVLIVLDDVDHEDQLYKLVGDGEWLCNGSKVIITTRDKHLFTQFKIVVENYEVKKLEKEKALELFSWHAFKKESPENGFENLSTSFVTHASGLPLALKVWGSFLCGKTEQKVWENTLEKIKGMQDGGVIEKLMISYKGLDKECKKVFLDIVCFFRDERRNIVEEVLNNCKLHPVTNISVLIDRCLLFESRGFIHMHDLIHEMGLSIESKKRSRRWRLDDLDYEPMVVERLLLSFDCDANISPCIDSIKQMTELKMLLVKYQENYHCRSESHLESIEAFKETGIMNYLPMSLMVLKFPKFPWSKLFCRMEMTKLTYLDLSSSDSLLETPNFVKMPNLVNLKLSACKNLKTIHPSVGNLTELVKLNLDGCSNLEKLPIFKKEMKNITLLDLSSCSALLETPNFTMMPNLKYLSFSNCVKLNEIHPSIENLTELVELELDGCNNLEKLPNFNQEMKNIGRLNLRFCNSLLETPNFAMIPNLEYLYLSKCEKLKEIHPSVGNLTKLVHLHLNGCSNLEKLPSINQEMKNITSLDLTSCSSLLETPNFAMMPNLKCLDLSNCEKLIEIHPCVGNLTELVQLALNGCSNLEQLPDFNQEMKNITDLNLSSCNSLIETPNFVMMPNLKHLDLSNCAQLIEIHPSVGNLTELVDLDLSGFSNFEKFPNFNQEMKNITRFKLTSCSSLLETPNFAMMPNLKYLYISMCEKLIEIHPSVANCLELVELVLKNCSKVEKLPNFNQEMKNITRLKLSSCSSLLETPNFAMMPNLKCLNLSSCEQLIEIHPSLATCLEIVELYLIACNKVEKLPNFNQEMKNITHLELNSCSSLLKTPNFAMMPNLEYFALLNCEQLIEIHPSLVNCLEIVGLWLDEYSKVEKLPNFNQEMKNILLLYLFSCRETPNFDMMPNLQYLELSNCDQLIEIHPSVGNCLDLVELILDECSKIEKLPNFNQEMKNIDRLSLRSCSSLLETPNFAMIPNLKYLFLSKCEKLKEIHPSIGNLSNLVQLNLDGCCNLENFPRISQKLKNITDLDLTSCSSLVETPDFAMMPNLKYLFLSKCEKLKEIHPSVGNLKKLVLLSLKKCGKVEKLSIFNKKMKNIISLNLGSCSSLFETPNFFMMPNLKYLNLSKCEKLIEIYPSVGNLTDLDVLDLEGCSNLEKLPSFNQEMKNITRLKLSSCNSLLETPNFAMMPNLKYLDLSNCEQLIEIHPSVGNLTELVDLALNGCSNLEKLPIFNEEMKNIDRLNLRSCSSLLETPNFSMIPNLVYLYLSKCEKLKEIHPSIENLTKLVQLNLDGCSNLEKLPSINQEMKNLTDLDFTSCSSLLETPNFAMMPNLKYLFLSKCEKLKEIHPSIGKLMKLVVLSLKKCGQVEELSSINQEMKNIISLNLGSCSFLFETPNFFMMPNLKYLNLSMCKKLIDIHPSVGNLSDLDVLDLEGCSNIKKVPSFNQEMKNITCLKLSSCSSLLETPNFAMMPNLKYLDLSNCEQLREIHPSVGNLTELVDLALNGCSKLEKLPNFNQEMKNIDRLNLRSCSSLIETPNFAMIPNLVYLYLSKCEKLKEIHQSVGNLTKLVQLNLDGCSNLEKLPNINEEMNNITDLDLTSCSSLLETPNFAMMPNLKYLFLSKCEKLKEIHPSIGKLMKMVVLSLKKCRQVEKLSIFNQEMKSIISLNLESCSSLIETPNFFMMPNLKYLNLSKCKKLIEIHPSIGNLIDLDVLDLEECCNLKTLPSFNQEMKNITCLKLGSCSSLLETPNFAMMPNLKYLDLSNCEQLIEIHPSVENLTELVDLALNGCSNLEKLRSKL